jgi:hypothetical protein
VRKRGVGLFCASALAVVVAVAGAAQAVPYTFVLTAPNDDFSPNYTWAIDSSPTPATSDPDFSFTVDGVVVSGDRPVFGHFVLIPTTFTFYFGDDGFQGFDFGGGAESYFGPQLFTGTVAAPTFKLGTFDLEHEASVTISGPPVAAPEPASWGLMLLGFGGLGGVLRRRRTDAAPIAWP